MLHACVLFSSANGISVRQYEYVSSDSEADGILSVTEHLLL